MRKIHLLPVIFSFTLLSYNASSQTKAVTETGDEVILYSNHTWKYSNEFKNEQSFVNYPLAKDQWASQPTRTA